MICKKCHNVIKDEYAFCPICGRATKPQKRSPTRRPSGLGCVYKLPGNRQRPWAVQRNHKYLASFATQAEAEVFLGTLYQSADPSLMTLQELHEKWMETAQYQDLSRDAQANYSAAWKRMDSIKKEKVRSLKTPQYQQIIDQMVQEGLGRDSCEKFRSLLSNLCKMAMRDEIIDRNYADLLELPKAAPRKKKRNLTDEDIIRLLYAADDGDRDAMLVLILLYTGMRAGELFAVKSSDVYLEERYIIGGAKTDAGRNRSIPIREEIVPYIKFFLSENNQFLCHTPSGKKIDRNNFTKRNFYPLLDRLGIVHTNEAGENILTPHRCRHTYISEAIKAKMAPEALTKIVGHSSYATSVDKYDDTTDLEYLRKEAEKGL